MATHWPEIVLYYSKHSEDISLLFDQVWLCHYPRQDTVTFDNGKKFSSKCEELLDSYGIKLKPTIVKNPQANAFIKQFHQVIANALHTMELDKRTIDEVICINLLQCCIWYVSNLLYRTSSNPSASCLWS
jgi:hypothetical protein